MRINGRPRRLTADDVAMTLELKSQGITLAYISHYAFGMNVSQLWHQLKTWDAL